MTTLRLGIVGTGWRSRFFHRIASALPAEFQIAAVVAHSDASAARVTGETDADVLRDVGALLDAGGCDVVIACASAEANADVMRRSVARGVPVLAETPPAATLEALRTLWSEVGESGLVQVAEQYLLLPSQAARLEVVRRGVIGTPTAAEVSSTHGYHAVSLMRGMLGVGFEPATVRAQRFTAPLVDPLGQQGWTDDPHPRPRTTTFATLDWGSALGVYDFTENQWHNQLRHRRIVIRGSAGELADDDVVHLPQARTITRSPILRRQLGYDLDLDGYDTDLITFEGEVVWRNPTPGARFADEEHAIAGILRGTAAWLRDDAPPPYPLAQACQDQLLSLAIERAADSGAVVTTSVEDWAA